MRLLARSHLETGHLGEVRSGLHHLLRTLARSHCDGVCWMVAAGSVELILLCYRAWRLLNAGEVSDPCEFRPTRRAPLTALQDLTTTKTTPETICTMDDSS